MALTLAAFAAAAAASPPPSDSSAVTILPNCESKCGDVEIPYPFGIGDGCFRTGFDLVCNRSLQPPRPFIGVGDTSIELMDVSLTLGRARAYTHIDWTCYNATDFVDEETIPFNLSTRPAFTISAAQNKFTAVGCAAAAIVGNDEYVSGCISACNGLTGTTNDTCDGLGCCQTAIPEGMTVVQTGFLHVINFSIALEFNPCSYAFIVEHDWYNFSSAHLLNNRLNQTYRSGVPVVLDWSVGNITICEEARRNPKSPPASYACTDKNSECLKSSNGEGYICNWCRASGKWNDQAWSMRKISESLNRDSMDRKRQHWRPPSQGSMEKDSPPPKVSAEKLAEESVAEHRRNARATSSIPCTLMNRRSLISRPERTWQRLLGQAAALLVG